MPIPLVPMAMIAGAYALARKVQISAVDMRVEDRLDDIAEGLSAHRDPDGGQINAAYRWKRTVRFGATGPGFEIDTAALGRLKIRKVTG